MTLTKNVKVNEIDTGPVEDLLLPKLKLNPDNQLQRHENRKLAAIQ